MLIKITIQEQTTPENATAVTYWDTVNELISSNKKVIAGTLRLIADSYDPPALPTKIHRS